ncbi:hypothetical protein F1741_02210, partial ['Cynodon dactylon' phytoplasma]
DKKSNEKKSKPYRMHSRNIGFTYPNLSLSKEEIQEIFVKKFIKESHKRKKKIYYKALRIARELHEDGEPHIHILIQLNKKTEFCNAREFFALPTYNKNNELEMKYCSFEKYFAQDTPEHWYRYIGAFGDILDDGIFKFKQFSNKKKVDDFIYAADLKANELKKALLKNEISAFEAEKALNDFLKGLDVVIYYKQFPVRDRIIQENFYPKSPNVVKRVIDHSLQTFRLEHEKIQFIIKTIKEQFNSKSPLTVVLEGLTQIGKTDLVELILQEELKVPYNYTKIDFNFSREDYNDNYKVCIYDDMGMEEVSSKNLMHGLIAGRGSFQTREPYGKKRTISGNKLNIFIVNRNKSFKGWIKKNKHWERFEHEYVEPNVIIIDLYEDFNKEYPMFYKPEEIKEMNFYKEKLKGANGRSAEILAKLIFGDDKVEVINNDF